MHNYTELPPKRGQQGQAAKSRKRRVGLNIDAIVVAVLTVATFLVGFAGLERLVV